MRHEHGERGPGGATAEEPLILPLETVRAHQRSQVGGKAAALGEMLGCGLPAPPGFCITTDAFRRVLSAADVQVAIATLDSASRGDGLAPLGAAVRLQLAAARMPVDIEDAILSAWRGSLRGVACVVRSSATAEDLRHASFAGQLDTILNVRTAEALLRAVRQCWGSVFSDRALAYRAHHGLGSTGVHMAVIVQELVDAEAAGVMFTINPLSGRSEEILIEGSYGLGEVVVSGRVTPDRFVVHKETRHFVHRTVSNKTHAIVPSGKGGVSEQVVAADAAQAAALSDGIAQRLAEIGVAVERHFGAPQDIEWATSGDEVFVLQSRPITTPLPPPSDQDGQVWTNMNAGEVMPDVVSPLTWSFLEKTLLRCFAQVLVQLGFEHANSPLAGRIAGRIYFNLNMLNAIGRAVPGSERIKIETMLGGFQSDAETQRAIAVVERNLPPVDLSLISVLLRLPRLMLWWLRQYPTAAAERRLAAFSRELDARRRDIGALDETTLVTELQRCVELFWDGMMNLGGCLAVGMTSFSALHGVCARWLGSEGNVANQLVTGVGGMASAEAGLAMWRLSTLAQQRDAVVRALLAHDGFAATRAALVGVDGGPEFVAHWDEFMARHGHHARGEIELMNRRWADAPDQVLAQVRSYLANLGGKDPVAMHAAQTADAARCAAELRQRLSRTKRMVFDFFLRRARFGVVYRENVKSEAVRLLAFMRHLALALGRRMADRGVIEEADDIFYLSLDELSTLPGDASPSGLHALVRRRRAQYERDCATTPPALVIGRLDAGDVEPEAIDTAADRLCGVGVSPGVVTGLARVILHSNTDERVLPGEILVAPFTDPGWTPYFQLAAGLVTDLGGLLSHGSIVAREYGLPAVVNVGTATRTIHTGDRLQLDGTRGEVRILERVKI